MNNVNPGTISSHILEKYLQNKTKVHEWLHRLEAGLSMPVYCSVDLRNSGYKTAPVDNNLFPAGFNNLCEDNLKHSSRHIDEYLTRHHPGCVHVGVLCEAHSRNMFYFLHLHRLKTIIEGSQRLCTLYMDRTDWPFPGSTIVSEDTVSIDTMYGPLQIKSISKQVAAGMGQFQPEDFTQSTGPGHFQPEDFSRSPDQKHGPDILSTGQRQGPDILLLNNDLSSGVPGWLESIKIPVIPSPSQGWHSRSKARHREQYERLACDLGELIGLDPWLITPLHCASPEIDFDTRKGLDETAELADELLRQISDRFFHYNIRMKPFLFVKSDAGTYGMSIMTIRSGRELLLLNRRIKNKMKSGKSGIPTTRLILEEGIPTTNSIEGCPAEPVIYHLGGQNTGVFFRINCSRNVRENLNSRGMDFFRYCNDNQAVDTEECWCDENWMELYALIGRLSQLAAAMEADTDSTQPVDGVSEAGGDSPGDVAEVRAQPADGVAGARAQPARAGSGPASDICSEETEFRAELEEIWTSAPETLFKPFREAHYSSTALYKDYHIPAIPWPLAISEIRYDKIRHQLENFMDFLEEFTRRVLSNPALRQYYPYTARRWEIIEACKPSERFIPIARMDAYCNGDDLQILEVNTDGSSGMSNAELITGSFLSSPAASRLSERWHITPFPLMEELLQTLIREYKSASTDNAAGVPEYMCIMDWSEVATSPEFHTLSTYFTSRGINTSILDPRAPTLKEGRLYHGNKPIDMIYRRMVSSEFFNRLDECRNLVSSVMDNSIAMTGTFLSDIAFNKRSLALISDRFFEKWMPDQVDKIRKIIPWTRILSDSITDWQGEELPIPVIAREHKDELVIKPGEMYGGKGVLIGCEAHQREWENRISEALHTGDSILQKRVMPGTIKLPPFSRADIELPDQRLDLPEKPVSQRYNLLLGPFMFDGKLSGFLSRATPDLRLDSTSLEISLPVLKIKRKNESCPSGL